MREIVWGLFSGVNNESVDMNGPVSCSSDISPMHGREIQIYSIADNFEKTAMRRGKVGQDNHYYLSLSNNIREILHSSSAFYLVLRCPGITSRA